jgi:hypothetical protein
MGTKQAWQMRSGNRSPNYTTRWDELPVAKWVNVDEKTTNKTTEKQQFFTSSFREL